MKIRRNPAPGFNALVPKILFLKFVFFLRKETMRMTDYPGGTMGRMTDAHGGTMGRMTDARVRQLQVNR